MYKNVSADGPHPNAKLSRYALGYIFKLKASYLIDRHETAGDKICEDGTHSCG